MELQAGQAGEPPGSTLEGNPHINRPAKCFKDGPWSPRVTGSRGGGPLRREEEEEEEEEDNLGGEGEGGGWRTGPLPCLVE